MGRFSWMSIAGIACFVLSGAFGILAFFKRCEGIGCLSNRIAALPSILMFSLGILLFIAGDILKRTSKRRSDINIK